MIKLSRLVCSSCGSDNMNSSFAKNEGETCREFGCFGTMIWKEMIYKEIFDILGEVVLPNLDNIVINNKV